MGGNKDPISSIASENPDLSAALLPDIEAFYEFTPGDALALTVSFDDPDEFVGRLRTVEFEA